MRLGVAHSARYGAYLTDGNGRALYLLEDGNGCDGACLGVWPPLFARNSPPTGSDPALRTSLIGTITRRDGARQVTYGGHPLYYYVGDTGPGQTLGQHVEDSWGEWYLVGPNGAEVEESGRRDGRAKR